MKSSYSFTWVFWLVLYCVVWRHFTIEKYASTLVVCPGKKQLGSTSLWCVPRFPTPIAYTYLFVWPKYLNSPALSKQKFFCRYFKIAVTANHGLIRDSTMKFSANFGKKWIVCVQESRINPKFPVIAHFRRSIGKLLFAERRWMKHSNSLDEDILAKQICKCFIWVTNLGRIHGEVLPIWVFALLF